MPITKRQGFVDSREFTDEDELTLKGRLQGIARDPRAGFLPTTHTEKNHIIYLLDKQHATDPDRLLPTEILGRIAKAQGRTLVEQWRRNGLTKLTTADHRTKFEKMRQTKKSVVLEWTDFLTNAAYSLTGLRRVTEAIMDCNPNIRLVEEIGENDEHLADAALAIRYIDGSAIREFGYFGDEDFDSFVTVTREVSNPVDDRRKYIYDEYSLAAEARRPEAAHHIDGAIEAITIGALREVSPRAIADQQQRYNFWENILEETARFGDVTRPLAQAVLAELPYTVR